MNDNLLSYLNNVNSPWGKLFYKILWAQLPVFKSLNILDFGSGFGITANHIAADNNVTAYDINTEMADMYPHTNSFEQTDILPDKKFDVIICHNVLEYVPDRGTIIKKFHELLKPDGILSVVKHNHYGRIMQKTVFENNITEAISLLDGGEIHATNFGKINYYGIDEFSSLFNVNKLMGIRTFFALQQNNEIKYNSDWFEEMFQIEMKVSEIKQFVDISFFHHLLLYKN